MRFSRRPVPPGGLSNEAVLCSGIDPPEAEL